MYLLYQMSYGQRGISNITKPIIVGGLSYMASVVIMGDAKSLVTLPLVNKNVSVHTYMGLLGGLSSLGTQTVSNWILPYLPMNSSYASYESALLEPAVNGGLNVAATYILFPSLYKEQGALKLAGTGLIGELGGDYIYQHFIAPNIKL